MSSIDRRIVDMKFENGEFQKRTKDTIGILDRLKEALKFKGATSGIDEVEKKASRFSLQGMADALSSIKDRFGVFGAVGFTAIQRVTNAAIDAGKKMAGALINPIVEGGKRRALNIEQAKFQFRALGLDIEKAMAAASEGVDGTAYGLDEAARAAANLAASNVPLDTMGQTLLGISGVAAMTNSGFTDIADVFQKVAGQGRVMGDDLNRLAARGLNAAAEMAKGLGVTEAELRKMVSKGEVSFEMFSTAMTNAFGESATRANELYTGSLSNVNAALSRIGADFQTPKLEVMRDIFNSLRPKINELHKSIGPLLDQLAELMRFSGDKLIKFIDNLDMTTIGETASKVFSNMVTIFSNLGAGLKSIFGPIVDAFRTVFPPKGPAGLIAFTDKLADLTKKLRLNDDQMLKLQSVAEKVFSVFKSGSGVIGEVTKEIWDFAKGVGSKIGEAFGKLDLSGIFTGITSTFGKAFDWLKENFNFEALLAGLAAGGAFVIGKKVLGMFGAITDTIESIKGLFERASNPLGGTVLDSLKNALNGFAEGIPAVKLVAIAGSVALLANALDTLSEIDTEDLVPSLAAMGTIFVMMGSSLKSFTNTMVGVNPAGMIRAASALVIMSFAIKNLADAVVTMSGLDFEELLIGLGGVLALLQGLSTFLNRSNLSVVSLRTAVALLAIAQSVSMLVDSVMSMSGMQWNELARGLGGLAGSLLALSIATRIIGGVSMTARTVAGILVIAEATNKLADAMSKYSELTWREIGRSITAMGLALGVLSTVTRTMARVGGPRSLAGAVALLILVQSLKPIADGLSELGGLEWSEIGRGLVTMGISLTLLSGVLTSLGQISGIKSILSATAILIAVQSLSDIAEALNSFGSMSWSTIVRGLVGMGGALLELGLIVGILGSVAPLGSILGAAGLLIAVQGLEKIAKALKIFGEMSWSEIGRGLTGMAGALASLAVVVGVLGTVAGLPALLGSGAILLGVQALEPLARALTVFGEMSWSEIGRGLTAMAGALTTIALGGILNTLSIIGAASIQKMAIPLGDLAESIMKWEHVRVPSDLGISLASLSLGIMSFTWAFPASAAIAKLAGPLGVLADSVRNWYGVKVAPGMEENLSSLSKGVKSFTWAFLAAKSIQALAKPFGDLAGSVKKWIGVTLPKNLEKDLKSLSSGVKSFTWAFMAGWSMSAVVRPLGDLAGSVKKWSGVTLPKNLEKDLKSLSEGVKSFTWAFLAGWSMSAVVRPLGDLAGSVKKWIGVTLPKNLEKDLKSLSEGVKSFTWAFLAGWSMSAVVGPLGDLAGSVRKWSNVTMPKNLEKDLKSLSEGVKSFTWAFMGGWSLSAIVGPLSDLAGSVKKWIGVKLPATLEKDLKSLSEGVESFTWAFMGGWSLSAIVGPLSDLAGSVKKWIGVQLPATLERDLKSLSEGVKAFTWAFMAGWSLSAIVEPLSDLAGSVKKWIGVNLPKNLEENLKSLSRGVEAFRWAFLEAWSISALTEPLGDLAGSVKKWSGVNVPKNMESQLVSLANGIKSFRWAFLEVFLLRQMAEPIGDLAGAVKKWRGVNIPANLELLLKGLARGLTSLIDAGNLNKLASDLEDLGSKLQSLASFISATATKVYAASILMSNSFRLIGNGANDMRTKLQTSASSLATSATVITTAARSIQTAATVTISGAVTSVGAAAIHLRSSADTISVAMARISTAFTTHARATITSAQTMATQVAGQLSRLSSGMGSSITNINTSLRNLNTNTTNVSRTVSSSIGAMATSMSKALGSMQSSLRSAGSNVGLSIGYGIQEGLSKGNPTSRLATIRANILNALISMGRSFRSSGVNVGLNLVYGIQDGLNRGSSGLVATARNVANRAVVSMKNALQIRSPSRITTGFGEELDNGLIAGMINNSRQIESAASTVGNTALDALKSALSEIEVSMFDDLDMQPTITPVLDLTNVRLGASELSRLSGGSIEASQNYNSASDISHRRVVKTEELKPVASSGVSLTFNQTNNSPKALSSVEIYRQTKNQISTLKGALPV